MDRRRRRTRALAFLVASLGTLAAAKAADVAPSAPLRAMVAKSAPLRAMRWIAPATNPAVVLTRAPRECVRAPAAPDQALLVEVGRAAFRTPVVLGGQAARAGLSCDSCHRNGRGNPDFRFPGHSGAPGTADVTSSLFSSHRGNGVDDPKPIPDLGGPKAALKVSQAPGDPDLERFLHGLVTEEFDGPEPPPVVLKGLAAYVRAMDPALCPVTAQTLRPQDWMADADRAAATAATLAAQGDRPGAVVMLQAARARLGDIDERYAAPDLARLRTRLRDADARLAALTQDLRAGRPGTGPALAAWRRAARALAIDLAARQPRSLFNPARLSQAKNRRLPANPS